MKCAIVSCVCKKQAVVALSTMEAKFIEASQAGLKVLELKELFKELKLKISMQMLIWIDNQAGINLLKSAKSHSKAKHVDIRLKFICHIAQTKVAEPRFI